MDNREAVRVPVGVRARCRSRGGVVIDGLVEDVSRNGLFLRTFSSIHEGAQADLDIHLPGETLRLMVEVVRVERRDEDVGIGLRFVEQPTPNRLLANLIMRQHEASR